MFAFDASFDIGAGLREDAPHVELGPAANHSSIAERPAPAITAYASPPADAHREAPSLFCPTRFQVDERQSSIAPMIVVSQSPRNSSHVSLPRCPDAAELPVDLHRSATPDGVRGPVDRPSDAQEQRDRAGQGGQGFRRAHDHHHRRDGWVLGPYLSRAPGGVSRPQAAGTHFDELVGRPGFPHGRSGCLALPTGTRPDTRSSRRARSRRRAIGVWRCRRHAPLDHQRAF